MNEPIAYMSDTFFISSIYASMGIEEAELYFASLPHEFPNKSVA